jgi:hypothetical protein
VASTYTYIVTIGVLLLITMTAAYFFIQQMDAIAKAGQRAALAVAASQTLAGMWSAVEEAKLAQAGGIGYKNIYVGFPYRAEVGSKDGTPLLCVTAFGLRYERPLPKTAEVTYLTSASGGSYVIARAVLNEGEIEVSLVMKENGEFKVVQPTECFAQKP